MSKSKLVKAKTSIKNNSTTNFMEQLYCKAKLDGSIKQTSHSAKMKVMG